MSLIPYPSPIERIRSWQLNRTREKVAVERTERGGGLALDAEIGDLASRAVEALGLEIGKRAVATELQFDHLQEGLPLHIQYKLCDIREEIHHGRRAVHRTFHDRAGRA